MVPFIDIHTHKNTSLPNEIYIKNIFPGSEFPNNPFSIGLHPWYAKETDTKNLIETLEMAVQNPYCYTIGEIGLDKVCDTPYSIQQSVFELQVQFAQKAGKPVIIHNVKSTQEILNIIKGKTIPFIFHGFTGNYQTMKQILDKGGYISFGKSLMQHKPTIESLTKVPQNSFFLETDESCFTIDEIYLKARALLNIDISELKNNIYSNYKNIFNK